ncbi:MAG: hypothetical protein WAN44_10605 [Propionibacteriaceae bacterium]
MAEGLHDHQTTQPSPQTGKAAATRSADGSGPGVGVGGFATRPGEQLVEPAAGPFVDPRNLNPMPRVLLADLR